MIDMLEARDLMKMVQKLSPVYRLVFNLHVLEGMKHKEIALLLGITEGTSKSNLADARRALQKLINGQAKMDQVQNQAI
jgi:RNA polymerase sigma-70 factor (ECF subfamily)